AVDLGVGQGKDHGHFLPPLALAIDATLELLELSGGPGQVVDDKPVADALEAIDAVTDRAGANQDIAVTFPKAIEPRSVLTGEEAHCPGMLRDRIAQQAVDSLNIVGVDERLRFDLGADNGQPGAGEDLLQRERRSFGAERAYLVEELATVHRKLA